LPVEALNRVLGVRPFEVLDEREPTRPARLAVDGQHDLRGRRDASEVGAQIGLGRGIRQIANEQTDSQSALS
jgi:hypothetical protein